MSRKIAIIFLFLVALSVLLTSCLGGAQSTVSTTTGAPAPLDIEPMGDADGDGDTDEEDYTLFSAYLAREATEMHYEFCDLNGDFRVDESDAELLRAYLDGERIGVSGGVFSREDAAVLSAYQCANFQPGIASVDVNVYICQTYVANMRIISFPK